MSSEQVMTYYEAALEVLRLARQPLSTQEVTERAIAKGLISPAGARPQATMAATLYRRASSSSELLKIEDPGESRAKRGSVRWAIRGTASKKL